MGRDLPTVTRNPFQLEALDPTIINLGSTIETQPYFFFSSRRRHTSFSRDWSSDVCSSDLLLAHATNVNGHRAGVARVRVSPDAVHQLLAGEDAARMRQEEPEQIELLGGQLEQLAVAPNFAGGLIDLELTEDDALGLGRRRTASAEDVANTDCELARGERLGHVVVCAELEADDPIGLVPACGQHDHG